METNINYQEEIKSFPTTSAKIRHLASLKVSRSEISKILNIRYQHVRNVLEQKLKKS